MGNQVHFTGTVAREHGVVPTRVLNRIENASELEFNASDLTEGEIAAMIAKAEKLESLRASGHALTPAILAALATKDRLQVFHWTNAGITDAAAIHFRELDHLRVFCLGQSDITTTFADGFAAGRRHLWQVALEDCLVDDDVTRVLAGCSNLRVLSLARSFVTGATIGDLATTQLSELHLDGCDLDATALGEALTRLSAIKVLSLDDTAISDDQIHYLIGRPHLTRLSLRRTRITDQALGFLAFLPQRTQVQLTGTAITSDGLAQLRAKRTDLVIDP